MKIHKGCCSTLWVHCNSQSLNDQRKWGFTEIQYSYRRLPDIESLCLGNGINPQYWAGEWGTDSLTFPVFSSSHFLLVHSHWLNSSRSQRERGLIDAAQTVQPSGGTKQRGRSVEGDEEGQMEDIQHSWDAQDLITCLCSTWAFDHSKHSWERSNRSDNNFSLQMGMCSASASSVSSF